MSTTVTELAVPLLYETLRERGSKLRAASRREVRATTMHFILLYSLIGLKHTLRILLYQRLRVAYFHCRGTRTS
ncbi:MAG: hypothetical protein V7K15_24860 [Nostoc sp.]